MRSCNGQAPLIIQEQRARAGQEVQPRRVVSCTAPNSSTAHGMGRGEDGVGVIGKVSVARTLSHSGASLDVIFYGFLPLFIFLSFLLSSPLFSSLLSLPNLHEVVQRARPSYNPRGTCPRLADSPAAPSETDLYTQQFQAHRRGEE
jgi:hypothetical protein